MTSTAIRIYTAIMALACGGAIVFALQQQHQADTWQSDSRAWQDLVAKSTAQDQLNARRLKLVIHRYNLLVRNTTRSQRKLLAALQQRSSASTSAAGYTATRTVTYSTGGGSSSPAPAPVATSSAPPPTTKTS